MRSSEKYLQLLIAIGLLARFAGCKSFRMRMRSSEGGLEVRILNELQTRTPEECLPEDIGQNRA